MDCLLQGILIGIIFGVPGGAIGALTVQRTFYCGRRAGLLTGLGSSCADSFYAFVGIFGITLISDFIGRHEAVIHMAGGSLILFLGLGLLRKRETEIRERNAMESAGFCLSSFALGMTNPATVFLFLLAFSYLDISGKATAAQRLLMVCGVFFGTYVWWGIIALIVPIVKRKVTNFRICYMNRVFGTILCLLGTVILISLFTAGCGSIPGSAGVPEVSEAPEDTKESASREDFSSDGGDSDYSGRKEAEEAGYNLPVSDRERAEAEKDCAAKTELVRDLLPEGRGEEAYGAYVEIPDEQLRKAAERIAAGGFCVMSSEPYADMKNYEKFQAFLERAARGEGGVEILYRISRDGRISRLKYRDDGKDMYVISAVASRQSGKEPVLSYLSCTRVEQWRFTEKGWFCYKLCVPKYPEVTEVVDGSCMVRVIPMTEENREMSRKCVLGVAYKGNNLFGCDWDAEHMEKLDYNGLYEYLYGMKYGEIFPVDENRNGIPEEAFESLLSEYLPVTEEMLREYAVYDGENHVYAWEMQEYSNEAPVFFSASVPEVTQIRENEDGTVTLTVDAVCELLLCDDAAITHEVTLRFREDGSFQYLGNRVVHCSAGDMPEYRYRIRERG